MQLIKNVYLIGGFPFPYTGHGYRWKLKNMYAVKGDDAIILIDTGEDETQLGIALENLEYWGLSKYPISHVLITHSHFAHSANAHILRKQGAKIVAGYSDAEGIEAGDDRTIGYAYTNRKKFEPCTVDIKVKDGDVVSAAGLDFTIVHVPGHSTGSVLYRLVMDGKIVLFTGDTVGVAPYCSSAKLGWTGGADYNQDLYIESIKKIFKMDADIILPGDLQPCLREGWQILECMYTEAKQKLLNQPPDLVIIE